VLPGKLLTTDSTSTTDNKGSVNRQEALLTNVAAVVTQVLPNGNLVVEGKQEVLVNFEIRELIVAGIVRPEDIESDNTIDSTKIAQARIAYGGRGQITDIQQPRYGQQVVDILLPFQLPNTKLPRCSVVHNGSALKRGLRLSPPGAA
jgi:flagellar L-ring protein precursor FlgH